jgi:hypothetical protein
MTTSFGRGTALRVVLADDSVAPFGDTTCAEAALQLIPNNIAAASPAAGTENVGLRLASLIFLPQRVSVAEYHALHNRTVNSTLI